MVQKTLNFLYKTADKLIINNNKKIKHGMVLESFFNRLIFEERILDVFCQYKMLHRNLSFNNYSFEHLLSDKII